MVYPIGKLRIPGELVGARPVLPKFIGVITCAVLLIMLAKHHFSNLNDQKI
jgi:hypothetical protein